MLAAFALVVGLAPALAAQDKPTPAMMTSFAGKWTFDQSRSDSITPDMFSGGGFRAALGGGRSGGGGGGGGGGGRGGRSRAAAPAASPIDSAPQPQQQQMRPPADPKLAAIMGAANPGRGVILAVNDSILTMANSSGQISNFKMDGKKRQEAQMDGSVIETQAGWKDGTMQLMDGVAGVASLKREYKVLKDGNTLELKETVEIGGRKTDKKLVFTRTP